MTGVEARATGHILVVDDEPALRRAFSRILEDAGYTVTQAADGRRATDALATASFDVIVTDISMPEMTGTQLLHHVRERKLDVPVLLLTANPTLESAIDAVEQGAMRYLLKPVSSRELLQAVERAAKLSQIGAIEQEAVAYLASVGERSGERSAMEASLRGALDTLWMAYQPIVDWPRQRVVAFEALLRTDEPTVRDPGELFRLAERLDRVHEVGRAVRASVARTLIEHQPSIDVFVNLHPSDLLDETLYSSDDPLAPFAHRIVLEITERQALGEAAGISTRAARLRKLGYRLAIDDLGAGYAGLNHLAKLTPDVVKIDMSLVRDVHRETIKQKLVGSLIMLCKDLGMSVIAEGIETVEERAVIVDLGCDLLQGYLLARPGKPFPDVRW